MSVSAGRYEGAEPYIFISYSHADRERVLSVVAAMDARGYNVWYDVGINAGEQWTAELAEKIACCEIFMPFISRTFRDSTNCIDELRHAHRNHRNIVPVRLNLERELFSEELKFLLQNSQGAPIPMDDRVPTPEVFAAKLDAEPLFQRCRRAPNANADKPSATPHTSNADYADWFQKPLFLHAGKNDAVNLTNLFVKHKFEVKRGNSAQTTVDGYLADFLRGDTPFLFIEGDAGCGKTSLTQYMSYHYQRHDATAQQIFGDRRLMTVRLREIENIPTDCRPEQRLTRAILRFLYGNNHDKDNLKRFQESGARLLWLDGYDELCTTEGINPQAALWPLESLGCKIVVTSRPNYIRFDWSKEYYHIVLKHFDNQQRQEWRYNYEHKCGERLGEVNRQYLERDTVGICDTPMGLYMVAAGHFTEAMLDNEWALYHQIFHEEIKDTLYNKPFGGFDWQHPSAADWESLYRVSEEIAWYLYRNKNADLLVSYETVDEIIEKLGLEGDKEQIVKRCFALCGYWNANAKQGYVEFYHNNIRDFFLCEKLMRKLNQAYQDYQDYLDFLSFLQCLCQLFQYDNLEKRVLEFLGQRALYAPDICVETEKIHHNTVRIFETLLMSGKLYFICKEQQEKENPVEIVARVMRNTVGVYRYLYEAFLSDGDLIHWWEENNTNTVNRNTTFRALCGEILHFAGSSSLLGL